ncbi:hypothetical protein ACH5RR_002749 [Cinchona calisaya]|uniref:Receptor-like serine/threonine-protein kinase n=1 Tax=Cinchona calisaya TaxID=153742 RepID=A0ABD3AT64_9GENT
MHRLESLIFSSSFQLCISVGFLLSFVFSSEIPLGSRISVEDSNYWASSNGDFAIGFFSYSNQYKVGIHFNSSSIPVNKQTVIWVAGADLTVGNKSYFQFDQSGEMVLFDSATELIAWRSKTSYTSVVSAVLRNDGNLVLLNKQKDVVWQSFDNPSDTLLPGQNFSISHVLRPPSKNSVSSYYSLYMAVSGQLQLRWETSVIYWTSGNPSQSAHRATLNTDGVLQLIDQQLKPIWSISGEDHNDLDVKFRFLRLDADGNLRLYSWQNASSSWRSVWQAVNNQCDVFATCGLHGICVFNESGSAVCKCPFTPAGEYTSKCLVPSDENCGSGSSLITYEHTFLYGIYPPNETIIETSLLECKILCREDRLCTAATFINNGSAQCRIKRTRYMSGKSDPSLDSISVVKMCSDPIAVLPQFPKSTPKNSVPKSSQIICIPCLVGVAAGTLGVLLVIQLAIGLYFLRRRKKHLRNKAAFTCVDPNTRGCIMLTYPEIRELTENFKHHIGSKVFKGVLPDNQPVAIKELSTSIEERKFRSAVSKIGSIYHKNLLKLDGYCCESNHRLLVYEFVKNGSLGDCLEDPKLCKRLTWRKRIDICLAVARAVSYLHTGCREFVNHGNLKCENVLLDDDLEVKVSEFGLQIFLSEVSDTWGTAEADVKDFGKMLVKMISGCQDADAACQWAYEHWLAAQGEKIADSRLEGSLNLDEMERALRIAFWCLQVDERMRPSMGEIVKVLEGTLPVDPPPPLSAHNHFRSSSSSEMQSDSEP